MRRRHALVCAAVLVGSVLAVGGPALAHETALAMSVDVEPSQPAAGENATVDVGLESIFDDGESVRVTEVTLYEETGDDAEKLDSVDPDEWVGTGDAKNWSLDAELDAVGERTLRAEIDLLSQDRAKRTITQTAEVRVLDPHPSLALSAEPVGPSGETEMALSVASGAGSNLSGVEIDVQSTDVEFAETRRVVSSLAPGNTRDVTLPVSEATSGEATVRADVAYTTGDGERRRFERTLSATVESLGNPGAIELTGLRIEQEGRTLLVRGSASNPGATNATGTTIRAVDGEHVAPAPSRASFFVGDVGASDYASFEVRSRLTDAVNGSVDIPVQVEYAVDGERVVENVTLSRVVQSGGTQSTPTQSGGLPVVPLAIAGVVVLGLVGWRRYR